jgi:hypothetical protein
LRKGLVIVALLTSTTCSGVGPFGTRTSGEIAIDPGQVVLGAIGARRQLSVTDDDGGVLPPGNGTSWISSDPGVAAVDGSGMVTAAGDGQATITATLGEEQATALVTVTAVIETTVAVTAADQSDPDPSNNQVVTTITVVAP